MTCPIGYVNALSKDLRFQAAKVPATAKTHTIMTRAAGSAGQNT